MDREQRAKLYQGPEDDRGLAKRMGSRYYTVKPTGTTTGHKQGDKMGARVETILWVALR